MAEMIEFKSKAKEIEAQEKEFVFASFDSERALKLGLALIAEAKERNNKYDD